jgi:hypothetical protein
MIELIREKFPIFLLVIACCLFLFVGKSFYDDQLATTKYKGVVVNKGYELPTSGYKSSTNTKYIIYMREDITQKVIRVEVKVPVYFSLNKDDKAEFELSNPQMYKFGNTDSPNNDLYGK